MALRARSLLLATLAIASAASIVAGRSSAASVPLGAVQQQGWAPSKVDAAGAWAARSTTAITIAVVDTGVDPTQPALAGKLVAGYDVASRAASRNSQANDTVTPGPSSTGAAMANRQ